MKRFLKRLLQGLHIYYPLHGFYRNIVDAQTKKKYRAAYKKYEGKGFICNFCNAQYKKFVPQYPDKNIEEAINKNAVIAGFGENVYCPNCLSKNRERLVLAVLQNDLNVTGKSILHFSPEKNLYNFLKDKARVTTVDIMPGLYRNIDKNIIKADATKLHFADNSFDMIIANHILEHIPEDVQAMKEMYRVLKPNGSAVLQVPYSEKLNVTIEEPFINDPKRQERLFGQRDHVRIYALKNYVKRLESAGFTVTVLSPQALHNYKKFAVQDSESVVIANK